VIRFVGGLIAAAGFIWVALCGTCAYSVLSGREFGTPQDNALPFIVVALAMSIGVLTISVGFRVMFASSGGWRGWNAFLAGVLIVIGVLIVGLGIGLGVIGFAMAKGNLLGALIFGAIPVLIGAFVVVGGLSMLRGDWRVR
jgi:hypothetical protein